MNKLIAILMIFVLLSPFALSQEVSEVQNPNEPTAEDGPQEADPELIEEPECTNDESFCYNRFSLTECVDEHWVVNEPTIGICGVECFETNQCRASNEICQTNIHKCIVIEEIPSAKEQGCRNTGGTWIDNEASTSNVDEGHCDCSEITPGKWKWNSVEVGCKVVIQEVDPEDPIDETEDEPEDEIEDETSSSNDDDDEGTHTSGSGYKKVYKEQETEEETPLEEAPTEETIEETTEQKGFLNQITGFITGYNEKMQNDASYFLYPALAILLVVIVIFGVREIKF